MKTGGFAVLAAVCVMLGSPPAIAEDRICVEEVGGVCLKYKAAPKKKAAPRANTKAKATPAQRAENSIGLNRADRRRIQAGLKAEGYYKGGIDGSLGPASRRSIASWQRSNGVRATGYLTQSQVAALNRAASAAAAPKPAPTAPAKPVAAPKATAAAPKPEPAAPARRGPITKKKAGDGFTMELTFNETGPNTGVINVALKQARTYQDTCRVPLTGSFECYLNAGRFGGSWLRGEMPNVKLIAGTGSNSPGGLQTYAFKFW